MACDLISGRVEPCKDSVGGLKNLYFVNYGDLGAITYDATNTDVIDAVAGSPDAFKYEIKGASSFTQNIQSSRDTGTTVFEQVVEVTLKKLSVADHMELKMLAFGRPHVIIEDNNGNYFLAGLEHGCDVTGGTIVTGSAMSDLSGYTLTLTGMERVPANFLGDTPDAVGFDVISGS